MIKGCLSGMCMAGQWGLAYMCAEHMCAHAQYDDMCSVLNSEGLIVCDVIYDVHR